ncbi:MAG: alpha/beta hydrolase [SAR324 cluster bacterium]|uniref:Alpha/beta hydrolase n=1 Tax=SAR324 cluster bacterium TaxID=2024889 RepID=A0A2A4T2W7_9DELT|nr:MAG: alpha/beta hydrolase [SAR324 cluster bacterium]
MENGYTRHGQGKEKVLVLHDWLGDSRNYDPMLPYLDPHTFTYIFIDLRGYGKSKAIKGEYTVEESTADVIALANSLEWDKFHLVGHSMSGMIVQRLAIDHKDRIKSLIALTPVSASGLKVNDSSLRFFSNISDEEHRRMLLKNLWGSRLSHQWVEFKLQRWLESATNEAVRGYLTMYTQTNFAKDARGLQLPIMVMVGQFDRDEYGVEAIKKTYIAWHPNVELNVCANAGHYPMQETPVYTATTIEDFLRRHF